ARLYKVDLSGDTITRGAVTVVTKQTLSSDKFLEVAGQGLNPKAAATWQITPDVLTYASASRGFQYGGVNLQAATLSLSAADHPTFKSSDLWNYEVGARTDWLDRTLRLDLTLFHLDWNKPQVFQVDDSRTGLNGVYIDNVGAARGNGVEGTFRYLTPIPGLSLSIAGSYIVLKTATDFITAAGGTVPSGTDMPLSPRVQTSTTLNYTNYFGPWVVAAAAAQQYQGKAYNNIAHTFEVYDYSIYNLSLNLSRPDLPLAPSLMLIGSNLTDVRGITGINGIPRDLASGGVPTSSFPPTTYTRPRSISLRFTAEF
ncbi:MAG TPA: TonB-dependent receptor, partial [Nevskiaceae bacterium]|nr:TonB-dependent receptor [Nevskiaceae bacterium]